MKVGIAGASGYTGAELLRLLSAHPTFEVGVATAHSHAGQPVGGHTPSLRAAYPGLVYEETDVAALDGLDLVFCALPHGESQKFVPALRGRVGCIVDLAADFRLKDAALYPQWYGEEHGAPELLAEAVFGLPELFRERAPRRHPGGRGRLLPDVGRPGPGSVAAAGTRSRRAASWSTPRRESRAPGAGSRTPCTSARSTRTSPPTGCSTHRHTPEIEQILGAQVLFTPHLAPMVRGILATCYARPSGGPRLAHAPPTSWPRCTRPTTTSPSWW